MKLFGRREGLLFLLLFAIALIGKSQNGLDIVQTDAGRVSGQVSANGDVHSFKGIPFAAPPLGELRWKAPQPVKPWQGVRACTSFSASPVQAKPVPFSMWSEEFLIPKEPISEDCLYLNVWSGAKAAGEKRPVLLWIYGGGFMSGGSAVPIYDGEAMARKGIVFVSINYRVGIFGFFAHPELSRESGRNASGNYALLDMIAALEWVNRNISAFGGDPGNVTIAGQSAGSFAVNCLLASPLGKGLIHRAIGESGASFSNPFMSLQKSEEAGLAFAKACNANSVEDLRRIPADELMKKTLGMRGPITDGYVLPASIAAIYDACKENKVPLLTGWNQDEGLFFGTVKNAEDFKKEMIDRYGSEGNAGLDYYPATNDSIAKNSQYSLASDMVFGTQNFIWANKQSEEVANVFVYRFARKVPGTGIYAKYGAFHTGEVPYAYDNLKFVNRPWQPVDYKLAETMSSYWANFAATGNPNGKGLPEWKAYNTQSHEIMILDVESHSTEMPNLKAIEWLANRMNKK